MKKVDFCLFVTETFSDAELKVVMLRELEKRGYSCFALTTSEAADMVFRRAGLSNFQNLEKINIKMDVEDSDWERKITEIEKNFGIDNVRTEILSEKIIFKEKDEKPLIKKFIFYLLALKKLFDEEIKATYFIQGLSGSLNSLAFYYVTRKKGKHLYSSPSPFPGLIYFSSHPWGILEIDDGDIKAGLSDKEKKFISDYIKKLKAEKKLRLLLPLVETNPYITKERIKTFFRLLKTSKTEQLPLFFIFKNFWKRYFRKFYVQKFYSQLETREKYAFFPLHFPADSQLTARAIPFISQEFLVETISRYLPAGYKLYVKEHPAAVGYFPVAMLSYISKLSNVKIIPPSVNPYDLIEKSKMVFVINSNVGFEALMYRKPVITLGKSHYRGKGVTLDVESLYDLPDIINKAKDFRPSWDRILTLFYLWYKNSFPPPPIEILYTNQDLMKRNIKIFCDSLLRYLKIKNSV